MKRWVILCVALLSNAPCLAADEPVDDRLSAERSASFYQALKKAGVSGELHVYARGGHGFGMRDNHQPVSTWPTRLEEWMNDRGFTRKP
jgi:acetyl esterase/lipase